MTEDEMVGWHHRLNGHGFGWTLGDGEGEGSLVCCSPCGHKALDTTEQQNYSTLSAGDLQALSIHTLPQYTVCGRSAGTAYGHTAAIHCLLQI